MLATLFVAHAAYTEIVVEAMAVVIIVDVVEAVAVVKVVIVSVSKIVVVADGTNVDVSVEMIYKEFSKFDER